MPEDVQIKLVADAKDYVKNFEAAEKAVRSQTRALEERALELKRELDVERQSSSVSKEKVRSLEAEFRATRRSIAEIRLKAGAYREEAKAAQAAEKETSAIEKVGSKAFGGIAAGATAAVAGVVSLTAAIQAVAGAFQTFGTFERTLNTIKAVSGSTAEELDQIKQSSIKLGASTIFTNQEVANSYLNLSKSGFTAAESLAAMPGLLSTAAAAGGDLSEAASVTAGVLRGFGLEAGKSAHVADVLATAANVADGEISDFGQAFKQLAPVAATTNQSLEDSAALLAILANRMIKGSDAGTDLKGILSRMVVPENLAAIEKLGIKVSDATGKIRPLIDIIKDFKAKFGTLRQDVQAGLAVKIAGQENMKSFLALIGVTTEQLDQMRAQFQNVDGASEKTANTINQGLNRAWGEFTGAVETLTLAIGEGLAPTIIDILNFMTKLLNLATDNAQAISNLINESLGLVRAFGDLIGELTGTNSGFKDLNRAMDQGSSIALSVGSYIVALTNQIDELKTSARQAANEIEGAFRRIKNVVTPGNFNVGAQNRLDEKITQFGNAVEQRNLDKRKAERIAGLKNIFNPKKPASTKKPPPLPDNTGDGTASFDKGKAKKTKADHTEIHALDDQLKGFKESLQDADLEFDNLLSKLPRSFTGFGRLNDEVRNATLEMQENQKKIAAVKAELEKLQGQHFKTAEAEKKRKESIKDLQQELVKLDTEQNKNSRTLEQAQHDAEEYAKALDKLKREHEQNLQQIKDGAGLDELEAKTNAQLQAADRLFQRGRISIEQFRDKQISALEQVAAKQVEILKRQLDYNLKQQEVAKKQVDNQKEINDLAEKEQEIRGQIQKIENDTQRKKDQINGDAKKEAEALSDSLRDQTKDAIKQAFVDAFSGQGLGQTLKNFGNNLKNIIINAFAEAFAKRIVKLFESLFDRLAGFLQKASGAAGGSSIAPGDAPFKTKLGGSIAGAAAIGFTGYGIGRSTASPIAGALLGGAAGALGGLATGAALGAGLGPIGAAVGAVIGAGAGLVGGFGGKAAKEKAARQQKALEAVQNSLNSLLSGANPDDVKQLLSTRQSILNTHTSGRDQKLLKRDAIAQVEALIRQRYQLINQTIDELKAQNFELGKALDTLNNPFKSALNDREVALKNLETDTQKALYAFRDSQTAQTEILRQESLKRQAIEKQAQQQFEDSANSLQDLLDQRDQIENQNVFTRFKTAENFKADDLKTIDKDIFDSLKEFNAFLQSGIALPAIEGINQLKALTAQAITNQNQLEININGAQDLDAVKEEVLRAFTSFFGKNMGVNAI